MAVIEIGKLGRQVDGRGVVKQFTPEFFNEVIQSYNPKNYKAPAIISHNTQGIPDKVLHKNKSLSYGVAKSLSVVGDRLKVNFDKLSPKIKNHFDKGELLAVSPSFYHPKNRANPTPGKWSLRHCAFLGAEPPAIKGLASPEFSESGFNPEEDCLDFTFSLELNEEAEDLEFSIFSRAGRNIISGIRDWLIEKHGKEEADKIIPANAIAEMEANDQYLEEDIRDLRRDLMKLKYPEPSKQVASTSVYNEVEGESPEDSPDSTEEKTLTDYKEEKNMDDHTNSKTKGKKTKKTKIADEDLVDDDDNEGEDEETVDMSESLVFAS